jgi:Phage tail lysozyme
VADRVTPKDIYLALRQSGASEVQALGIMANMMAESGLNPEAVNPDGPQSGVGLVQWQTTDYPHAATLVTGSPKQDMLAQIKFLAMTGGFDAAQGSNAGQAAGNFASRYERCATCEPGGAQFQQRVENTLTLAGWARSGKWPTTVGTSRAIGDLSSSSGPGSTPDCAWKIDLNIPLVGGNFCILTKSELRGMAGLGLMLAGGAVAVAGLVVLAAAAGLKAAGPAGGVAEGVGAAMLLVPGAQPAGAAVAAAGSKAKNASRNPGQAARRSRSAGAREEEQMRRQLGEPRENNQLEARGGTVRENARQRNARRSRERAAADVPPF